VIKMNPIARTGLSIPSLTFGGASLANLFKTLSNREAIDAVEEAIELGWRSFDTAPHYGSGLSELRLGLGLRDLPRDDYVLSTKVGRLLFARQRPGLEAGDFFFDENPFDREYDYSYDGIMRSYEDSLQRLGNRRIDILYAHDVGTYTHGKTDQERTHFRALCSSGFRALEELKASGAIAAFGVGANEEAILMEVLDHAQPDIFMLANRYNLLEPRRDAFFGKFAKHGVSVAIAAPFATGILVTPDKAQALYEYGKAPAAVVEKVKALGNICHQYDVPMGAVALQFPLRNPQVVTVACGIQSAEQAQLNLQWATTGLPDALWAALAPLGIA